MPRSPAGHRYQDCDDEHCDRFPCKVYKEGYEDGHAAGYGDGQVDGYVEGYNAGQSAAAPA